jgi:ADP-heptose:LPS heptosyltransferase
MKRKILIIKHGALGDWILATGVFKLIREYYADSSITLLTQSQYIPIAKMTNWFDSIWVDDRESIFSTYTWTLLFRLKRASFDMVLDLQKSRRTRCYGYVIKSKKVDWNGKKGDLGKPGEHILSHLALQLKDWGINQYPQPNVSWLKENRLSLNIPKKYVLIIPGSSKKHDYKRWSATGYARLIENIERQGITSILSGTENDREIIESILRECKGTLVINLVGKPSLSLLAELARGALGAIGGDTGPMHIAGLLCPSLILFSKKEMISRCKPTGPIVDVLYEKDLKSLPAEIVLAKFKKLIFFQ